MEEGGVMVGFVLEGKTSVCNSEGKVLSWGKHLHGYLQGKYCTVLILL